MDKPVLTVNDAEYLHEYVGIAENLTGRYIDGNESEGQLKVLNDKFTGKLSVGVMRESVVGDNLTGYEGWVPSAVC